MYGERYWDAYEHLHQTARSEYPKLRSNIYTYNNGSSAERKKSAELLVEFFTPVLKSAVNAFEHIYTFQGNKFSDQDDMFDASVLGLLNALSFSQQKNRKALLAIIEKRRITPLTAIKGLCTLVFRYALGALREEKAYSFGITLSSLETVEKVDACRNMFFDSGRFNPSIQMIAERLDYSSKSILHALELISAISNPVDYDEELIDDGFSVDSGLMQELDADDAKKSLNECRNIAPEMCEILLSYIDESADSMFHKNKMYKYAADKFGYSGTLSQFNQEFRRVKRMLTRITSQQAESFCNDVDSIDLSSIISSLEMEIPSSFHSDLDDIDIDICFDALSDSFSLYQ